ncbi:RNA helicase [Rathayibacter rathayi]|uniref:RNA helicase n=1 Tax=Rathayibacter rathayi TaxID=33887 RepID=A0ABD6W6L5_RATRA|nr:DEAD/DEAH box helicase [Rathayibacter rathayi]AZZ48781.1 RNA helicase [Rathayibacter rathayi]MWV73869.1 DEAD/DEAH box helicase [Rathayibacter rathayi NCPPB 2980 = VKM Ac-1601]PPF11323.1 RNA helicase [Rathayibacter rathayi]PPF25388.1 RNA helicase [Rathayibacter rathayi]PPF50775.1 RNA helicase [Rathayibacter rathayi]
MTEPSPAERFAAFRTRQGHARVEAFRSTLAFDLDPFQYEACGALDDGHSVLVAAPTGAGKTAVAEFAIHLAMQDPTAKVFYTTPMKALSNQKFQEFVDDYGASEVGLLTGDSNVNSRARIVVMTTEVLRNMLYADSDLLRGLAYVVMDEVHYLADRFRGAVWEEVIIHLPQRVRLVSLSATVSNAEEFGDWLQTVRGETEVIVSEERPVPLDQHVLVGGKLVDLFDSSGRAATNRVNPELARMAQGGSRVERGGGGGRGGRGGRHRFPEQRSEEVMLRSEVVEILRGKTLLPAIFFVFSRAGCDQAVRQVLRSGVRLTERHERDEIRAIVEERCRTIRDEDLAVLGYWEWLDGLQRGVAAHHAGMLPAFKEVVEELFLRRLVRVVFATETLALGINMPARTVVLEKLEKFNGEARVPITPGEYTQLTGRAGRRGIDVEGHSVIQWRGGMDPQAVASLASRRTYPLNSSFRPSYNMAANLIEHCGRVRTREILESSFAQFQADRSVVDLARRVRQQEESMAGYVTAMQCHLGDFEQYAMIRREIGDLERRGAVRGESASHAEREKRQGQLTSLRRRMKAHPCHACSDREQHARWAERWWKLRRETDEIERQIRSRTGAIARIFDHITEVLLELGYFRRDEVGELSLTPNGRTLRRIYGERDLLVAECLRKQAWTELDPAGLAAMACCLVFEPRREEGTLGERFLPRGAFPEALEKTQLLWARLDDVEREHRLPGSTPISTSLALSMNMWAKGMPLDMVLRESDMAAGDFVRWAKQTIDLLDQLSVVAEGKVGRAARTALDLVRHGIVAYSTVA